MLFWDQVVEVLRESIVADAQVCNGNLGYGILIVTFLVSAGLADAALGPARRLVPEFQ